jgi:hypothetical protein
MVGFSVGPAIVAGFIGTVAMTAVMMVGRSVGMTSLDIPLLIGGMFSREDDRARALGMAAHIVMGAVVFGIGYGLLFTVLDTASAGVGALIGLVHGAVLGIVVMPMMGMVHPRMRIATGEARLEPPGVMGVAYGRGTPVGLLVTHVVYGLVVGGIYAALI